MSAQPGFLEPPVPGAAAAMLAHAAADEVLGRRFGPYRVLGVVAIGGMGTVYRAVRDDDAFERVVAVKVITQGLASAAVQRRFEAERRILARVSHPNIAALLDAGSSEAGIPYIVMEFVEGQPVDVWAAVQPLRARATLFATICRALHHAHAALVVHRDLKPANILVDGAGCPKIVDFGVARLVDAASGSAPPTLGSLTPRYASPEQRQGGSITTASDVYSIGVVLLEALTGAAAPEQPRHWRAALTTIPGDLASIVLRATDPEPRERYESAAAMADDLDRYLDARPVAAHGRSVRYLLRTALRRHPVAIPLAVACLVLAGTAGASAAWLSVRLWSERAGTLRALHTAEEISTFFAGTLEAADAEAAAGQEPTVRSLLDEGAARIATVEDLAARSSLHLTLGRAYVNLGRYQDAAPHIEAAVADARAEGVPLTALATALVDLGQLHASAGDASAAEAAIQESLTIEPGLSGQIALARVRLHQRDPAAARAILEGVLTSPKLDARQRLEATGMLADTAEAAGNRDQAVELRGRVVEAARLAFGAGSDQEVSALVRQSEVLDRAGRVDDAAKAARDALDMSVAAHGADHPTITWPMLSLALLTERQGDVIEAERLLAQARRIALATLPEGHYIPMFIRYRYGQFLGRHGRITESSDELRAAHAACVALLGPQHQNTLRIQEALDTLGTGNPPSQPNR